MHHHPHARRKPRVNIWEPSDCGEDVKISVRDDIANYTTYAVLGIHPCKKHVTAVQQIFADTVYATQHTELREEWAHRARCRGVWAQLWLVHCHRWEFKLSI